MEKNVIHDAPLCAFQGGNQGIRDPRTMKRCNHPPKRAKMTVRNNTLECVIAGANTIHIEQNHGQKKRVDVGGADSVVPNDIAVRQTEDARADNGKMVARAVLTYFPVRSSNGKELEKAAAIQRAHRLPELRVLRWASGR